MKKMNNKGFTLIELLAVLVILVVIMSIAIPSITSSVERSKAKQREQVINIIISAGELYADKHKSDFTQVSVPTLIDEGYLTLEDAKDPQNEKSTICGHVAKNGNSFIFVKSSNECRNIG